MLDKKIKIKLPIAVAGAVLLIIVVCVSFNIGKGSKLNKLVLQKAEAEAAIIADNDAELSKEIDNLTSDCAELDNEISAKSEIKTALDKYNSDKQTYSDNITSQNATITTLNGDISTKESELAKLTSGIVKTGEPITLGAGNHTVGVDIPAGRYNVTGRSNFVVYTASGSLLVNTILGGGSWGVDSYTCNLSDGYTIEASGSDTFQPVK